MDVLLHNETKKALEATFQSPPHALLLTGVHGVGLKTLAGYVANHWGTLLETIEPTAKSKSSLAAIGVEAVRNLYDRTRMKTNDSYIVIIDDADTMTTTAQNALLKLLEEPSNNFHFILTTHKPDTLLATIRSRTQLCNVRRISSVDSVRLLRKLGVSDEMTKRQLLFVADGLPAELSRLASNPKYLEATTEKVRLARDFITKSTYERALIVQDVSQNRQNALDFVETTMLLLKKSIEQAHEERNIQLLDRLILAKEAILRNANIRLQLLSVVL